MCATADQQPIVITEVMFDPQAPSSERNAEWFEVENVGQVAVDGLLL